MQPHGLSFLRKACNQAAGPSGGTPFAPDAVEISANLAIILRSRGGSAIALFSALLTRACDQCRGACGGGGNGGLGGCLLEALVHATRYSCFDCAPLAPVANTQRH